jgi:MFS family permease
MQGMGDIGAVMTRRPFLIYLTGTGISLSGTWMQRILVGWLAWELSGSGTWLGLIAAADLFPTVLLAPLAGTVVDRWNRMTVARVTEALAILQAALLAMLFFMNLLTVEILFALTLASGVIMAINQPARHTLIHSLVGQDLISPAVAIHSVVFNVARLVGPMAAGAAIVTVGIGWGFLINAVSCAAFFIALMLIRVAAETLEQDETSFLAASRQGIAYTLNHRGIAGVLLIILVWGVGVRPLSDLLPGYVDSVFSRGAYGLVFLTSGLALGAIIGSVAMTGFYQVAKLPSAVIANSIGVALATVTFILSPDFLWSVPVYVAVGFFMARVGIAGQIYVQLAAPDHMRGRVLSLHGMIQRGGPALGSIMIGAASDLVGFRWPLALGCLLLLAATYLVAAKRWLLAIGKPE